MFFFRKKEYRVRRNINGKCCVVIVAAGSSQRMDGVDKLFTELGGIPALAHTLKVFQSCGAVDCVIIAARREELERAAEICKNFGITKALHVVAGGETRLDSVINGIKAVPRQAELIAIHDGARPCVTDEIITSTIKAARKFHAAAPGVPVVSTLKRVERGVVMETIERDGLFEIQTPQVFAADLIKAALTNAKNKSLKITDDCMAVEAIGGSIHITEGLRSNIKITTQADIIVAKAILGGGTCG